MQLVLLLQIDLSFSSPSLLGELQPFLNYCVLLKDDARRMDGKGELLALHMFRCSCNVHMQLLSSRFEINHLNLIVNQMQCQVPRHFLNVGNDLFLRTPSRQG